MVEALGDYLKVKCYACIGGTSIQGTISKISDGQHIIVGTPGRVFDMFKRGVLGKSMVKYLLLIFMIFCDRI